jgi:multiple sugar transport system permease protein
MYVEVEAAAGVSRFEVPSLPVARAWNLRRTLSALQPYLYLLPALLSIGLWIYRPLVETLRLSFFQWNLIPTTPRVAVGWDNYHQVLTLPEMGQALRNTLWYVAGMIPFSILLPLAIALLIADLSGRSRGYYRAIIFLPVLMAPVVVAIVWQWILHPTQGVLNEYLGQGLHAGPVNFLRSGRAALLTIIGITGWKQIGFSVLLFSAGITNISRDYIDAASVDGASRLQIVRDITLPLLSPTIMFMLLLTVLLSAQWTFPLINVLTQGGPLGATTNVYYLLWEFGFRNFNVGFSSAAAVIFFVGFGLLALLCTRVIDRFSFYDA